MPTPETKTIIRQLTAAVKAARPSGKGPIRPSSRSGTVKKAKVKGMSLQRILDKTPEDVLSRLKPVVLSGIKRNSKTGTIKAKTVTREVDSKGHVERRAYSILVQLADPEDSGPLYKSEAVKVSCGCPYFMYHCEVALWAKGAADIIHSNGEHPGVKNPRMIPYPCKHLVKVLREIKKKKL